MSKKIARWARLVREIAGAAIALIKVIQLILELVNKAANCNVRELQTQISIAR